MQDEFAGHGGAYVMDPKTGKRRLLERTDAPQPQKQQPEAPAEPVVNVKPAAVKE